MNTELTIQLEDNLIHEAETYARVKNVSLSEMIESYLRLITSVKQPKKDVEITPLVKSLSGVMDLPLEFDYRIEYKEHLAQKYK